MEGKTYFTILYGSQTGTCEDLAKRICWAATRRNLSTRFTSMDQYPFTNLINEHFILFICSTMGQGEEPDNMKMFWKLLLRKNLPNNSLVNLNYAVIALGNSSYSKFNFVGKRLYKRIQQLGAVPLMELALGDDQHELGPDAAIDPWMVRFWVKLKPIFPIELEKPQLGDNILLPSLYDIEIIDKEESTRPISLDPSLYKAPVISNDKETAENHFQDVRLLKINIKNTPLNYKCGDVAIIQPVNLDDNVEEFLNLIKISPESIVKIKPVDGETKLPKCLDQICTVKELVQKYFDIQSIPKRSFFEIMRHFSKSELEKEKLEEFCLAKGQEELYTYVNRPRRCIKEILNDFPETTPYIPFKYLFDLIPPIRPRYFTIASSPLASPSEIHILVAVVNYHTRLRKPRRGLCSTYMSMLQVGDLVDIGVKTGTFLWPSDPSPVILIGPGTGCAPFRALTQERHIKGIINNTVFLGFRCKEGDYLCKEEWISLEKNGCITLHAAFSRDQDRKIYVQHKILQESEAIWNTINNQNAYVYIAGNAKQMPQDVQESLHQVFMKEGAMNEQDSKTYLANLERQKRLQLEVWE